MKRRNIILYLLWGIYLAVFLPCKLEWASSIIPGWHIALNAGIRYTPYYLLVSVITLIIISCILLYKQRDKTGFLLVLSHYVLTIFSILLYQDPLFLSDLNIVSITDPLILTRSSRIIFSIAQLIYLFFLIRMYIKTNRKSSSTSASTIEG